MSSHTFSLIVANKSNQFSYFTLASLYKGPPAIQQYQYFTDEARRPKKRTYIKSMEDFYGVK